MKPLRYFIISSLVVVAAILVSVFAVRNAVVTFNIGMWGLMLVVVPTMLMSYLEYHRIRKIENEFPRFLRDLAEASRSGLSVIDAFKETANGNYGELNSELVRVRNAIEWNIPFEKALERMRKRLSASDKLNKILAIMIQTYKSGADIPSILFGLSRDIETLREIENEKKTMLFRHVMMVYAIFMIFIVITVLLLKFMSPIIQSGDKEGINTLGLSFGSDPCSSCYSPYISPECLACGMFKGTASHLGFESSKSQLAYYKGLMFWMILVQALFSGMVAGFIESSSFSDSMKHSAILLIVGFLAFYLTNAAGII